MQLKSKNQTGGKIERRGGARPGAGRPKKAKAPPPPAATLEQSDLATEADLATLARSYGAAALRRLAEIAQTSKSHAAAAMACKEIIDRGFGKRQLFPDGRRQGSDDALPPPPNSQPAQPSLPGADDWSQILQ